MMAKDLPVFDPSIDPMRLDAEWLRQPGMYYEWAVKLADARLGTDKAKNDLELTKAEMLKEIRANPAAYGLDKITESTAANAVLETQEVKLATKLHLEAKHYQDIVAAAVATLDHRRRALENMVELHSMNYYSAPQAKGKGGEVMRETEKQAVRQRGQRERPRDDEE